MSEPARGPGDVAGLFRGGTAEEGESTPAATVIPLRDGGAGLEVLMLRRSRRGTFGGMWVFPGGQVDASDLPGHPAAGDEIAAARAAAVREAREEAAIELDPSSLVVLSFWIPPPESPRRFATWFFLARFEGDTEVVVDRTEIHEHRWMTPAEALDRHREGEIELAPPTYMTLWWLLRHHDTAGALRAASAAAPERFASHVSRVRGTGVIVTTWAGDAGYEDGDLERAGPRRRLVMDPAGWKVEVDS